MTSFDLLLFCLMLQLRGIEAMIQRRKARKNSKHHTLQMHRLGY